MLSLNIKQSSGYLLFAAFGAVVVLWQLLLGGYVLTLDMVFGPNVLLPAAGSLLSGVPLKYVQMFLVYVVGGVVTQKIFLGLIFFLLFYLPLLYFKTIFQLERTYGAEYVAAVLFAINPFVYERFLAGQWLVIFGYALLVPVFAYTLAVCREVDYRQVWKLAAALLVLGAVSSHNFMIAVIMLGVVAGYYSAVGSERAALVKRVLIVGVVLVCGSSYWLVPAVVGTASPLPTFTTEHQEVFRTAGDERVGVLGNVITLHGFWGEREPWSDRFILPKEQGVSFWVAFSAVLLLVGVGVYTALASRQLRIQVVCMLMVLLLAVIFSSGVGEGFLRPFNSLLFEHISFWKGFRDSQKWSGVVALLYALFAGLGAYAVLTTAWGRRYALEARVVLMCIPLMVTPMMLLGFVGQLHTTYYPESWEKVNGVLATTRDCKAMFLPWQQYYSLSFNYDILTANVSPSYFDCEIVHGKNMGLGSIESQGGHGEEYEVIEKAVTDNEANAEDVVQLLREKGVRYIIFTDDVVAEDQYKYPFLGSSKLTLLLVDKGIYLYRIN